VLLVVNTVTQCTPDLALRLTAPSHSGRCSPSASAAHRGGLFGKLFLHFV